MATAASDLDLECPVCHEDFKQAKFLPCTHVVCSKCILSWLSARRQAGCPLCRAPILPRQTTSQPQPSPADLSAIVDSLPTDFATMSLIESQRALSGDHECGVCDSPNATSYCLHCGVKLCKSCKNVHAKLPVSRDHDVEDLKTLTAARLTASRRSQCEIHFDKVAEAYCRDHKTIICLLCSTTHHRACSGVGTVGDVAVQARGEFQQQAQRLRNGEDDVTRKTKQLDQTMREALAHCSTCRAELKATFQDLHQQLEKREQEIAALLQQHQDDVMSRMQAQKAALEQQRVSLAAHAGSVERLIIPSPDSALLGMLEKLKARLDELEKQQHTDAGNVALKSAFFDKDVVTRLKREIGAFGQVTYTEKAPSSVTPVQPAKQQPATKQPAKQLPVKLPLARTVAKQQPEGTGGGGKPKPTGAELARVLMVGDRVRRGPRWNYLRGDEDGGGFGTVTAVPSKLWTDGGLDPTGGADVRWDNGHEGAYCMGAVGHYELELA